MGAADGAAWWVLTVPLTVWRRTTPPSPNFDPADPGVLTEFMLRRPFTYAGTGEQTGTHMMAVTTLGDMNVPASGGVNLARSAGLVDFLNTDSRWGKTPNQVLLESPLG